MRGAINGHDSVVSTVLRNTINPDKRDNKGMTALMRSAWNGHIDVVNKLLQGGTKVDLKVPEGRTALDHARRELNKEVMEHLLVAAPLRGPTPIEGAAPTKTAKP